jgi:hypothetical protein
MVMRGIAMMRETRNKRKRYVRVRKKQSNTFREEFIHTHRKLNGNHKEKTMQIENILNGDTSRMALRCPVLGCDNTDHTHVMDVRWEIDPQEGDRKRVRMEVRCESGHGFVLLIRNHAGNSFLECEALMDVLPSFWEAYAGIQ